MKKIFTDTKENDSDQVDVYRVMEINQGRDANIIGFTGNKGQAAELLERPSLMFDNREINIDRFTERSTSRKRMGGILVRVGSWRRKPYREGYQLNFDAGLWSPLMRNFTQMYGTDPTDAPQGVILRRDNEAETAVRMDLLPPTASFDEQALASIEARQNEADNADRHNHETFHEAVAAEDQDGWIGRILTRNLDEGHAANMTVCHEEEQRATRNDTPRQAASDGDLSHDNGLQDERPRERGTTPLLPNRCSTTRAERCIAEFGPVTGTLFEIIVL